MDDESEIMSELNWAGTYEYTAPTIVRATSIDEVRDVVRRGGRIRALGTRHSFTDLPDSSGTLVSIVDIDPDIQIDEPHRSVTVGGGTRYGLLAAWLAERGWALHNMGSLPHISVAGASATGTHGSGDGNGVLTTAIRSLEYVGADAELHVVHRGDPDFDALAVSLGAYGIVVRVTLDIQPAYRMRQDVYRSLEWDGLFENFDQITSAGYSVSIFTNWVEQRVGQVWVKTRLVLDDDPVGDDLFGAKRDDATSENLAEAFADNLTAQGGVPGDWNVRLPHFRFDATPSNGDEIQTEYFVDRSVAVDALRAVRALGEKIAPHLLVTELRTAAPDSLWLSGAYERELVAIHFTWANTPAEVTALLPAIEAALAPFDARPHWGKFHGMDAAAIARVTPRLADARAVFERLDPEGVFSNSHLERLGVREAR